ncbi:MAG TPA: hypothetical protein ENK84_12070 [Desulfobulbus sp.]|nr:hypothetical protein [Desulfobulbus sp.]
MNRILYGLITCMLAGLAWGGSALATDGGLTLRLARTTLQITTFYNGTTLKASGTLPADADVLLHVIGAKKNVALKVKGKVAGLLWMNKTDVELENAPAVYMVYTPERVGKDLLLSQLEGDAKALVKDVAMLGIGYKALVKDIAIKPESADKKFVFGEYVKLMEKAGVYAVYNGAVEYGPIKEGKKSFTVTLTIPPKMNAGKYLIEAITIKDGKPVDRTSEEITIKLSGLPKIIASLAYEHSLLFGIMAVAIAVATGLLIGVLFKGGGGAH